MLHRAADDGGQGDHRAKRDQAWANIPERFAARRRSGKYEAFADDMKISWGRRARQEQELVEQIINANWHLRRIQKMKAGALRSLMRENVDPVTFVDLWDLVTEKFNRYAAAEQAALYRAMHPLERLQDRRRNSSSAAQLLAAQDQARTLRELCEKRSFIAKPATPARPDARSRIAITAHSQRG